MSGVKFTVKCPKCSAKATAIMKPIGIKGTYREPTFKMGVHRLLCESCGLSKGGSPDNSEVYELWYVTNFRGHRLWACNHQHLSMLISWLAGDFRKQDVRFASFADRHFGMRVIAESLPKWMVIAKNRVGVLKSLRKMREK
jgi:hypothetical protein